jgi:hypothetical protein
VDCCRHGHTGPSLRGTLGGLAVATVPETLGESADMATLTDLTRVLLENLERNAGDGP